MKIATMGQPAVTQAAALLDAVFAAFAASAASWDLDARLGSAEALSNQTPASVEDGDAVDGANGADGANGTGDDAAAVVAGAAAMAARAAMRRLRIRLLLDGRDGPCRPFFQKAPYVRRPLPQMRFSLLSHRFAGIYRQPLSVDEQPRRRLRHNELLGTLTDLWSSPMMSSRAAASIKIQS
jgi:hypothetical protein